MMTMEQRIEAAARKLGYRHDDHTMWAVLTAAFPELFDGTAWIAPMAITPAVEATVAASLDFPSVFMGGPSHGNRKNARRLWDALTYDARMAHLTPAGRETSKDGEG